MRSYLKDILILILISIISFSFGFVMAEPEIFPSSPFIKMIEWIGLNNNKVNREGKSERKSSNYGRWRKSRHLNQIKKDELKTKLLSNPYLQGYKKAKKERGVILYDQEKSFPGMNLFSSGHAPKVFLIDMNGKKKYEWGIQFEEIWQEPLPFFTLEEHKEFIRRAYLYPDGSLLAVFEYIGIIKLDKNSNLLWSYQGQNHHDIYVSSNGLIYTLGRKMRILSKEFPDSPLDGQIADDFIDVLTPNGKVKKRISIFEAFYDSDYAPYLDLLRGRRGDVFHTNTILVIENSQSIKIPGVEKGDMLISIREMNTIALIDSETEKVKWAFMGFWRHQHQPLILPDGNILIFDNHGGNKESYFQFNQSRVIEFDPAAQKILWQYRGKKNSPFFTDICGFIQRLPNGNTVVTETMNGRAFEVTPDKEIVWEYVSPFRAGEKDQLVAVVCGMTRVNPDKLLFLNEN